MIDGDAPPPAAAALLAGKLGNAGLAGPGCGEPVAPAHVIRRCQKA